MNKIFLANPRGFCAGVKRAIDIVDIVLQERDEKIFVYNEIVHNKTVVEDFKNKGVQFVKDLNEVPDNNIIIFSAHGVSREITDLAAAKNLTIFDATCPLVSKVHIEANKFSKFGLTCLFLGHKNHPETIGTLGQYDLSFGGEIYLIENIEDIYKLELDNDKQIAVLTQTTLAVDEANVLIEEIKKHFHNVLLPKKSDICYATQNRQNAMQDLTKQCDLIFVVGSKNSSNSNRLLEIAVKTNIESYLIDNIQDIDLNVLKNKTKIGISAGASAPDFLVAEVIEFLQSFNIYTVETIITIDENMYFSLPKNLIARK